MNYYKIELSTDIKTKINRKEAIRLLNKNYKNAEYVLTFSKELFLNSIRIDKDFQLLIN